MNTRIELTPEAQAILRKLSQTQDIALGTMCQVFDKQNQLTVSRIQSAYLSFPKQGPPVEIGCRVQSNRLRSSVTAMPAEQVGLQVKSGIGSNVFYATFHEFGADFTRKGGKVRLLTRASGTLVGQSKNAKLAVFARTKNKVRKMDARFKEVEYGEHQVHFPARRPFTRGVVDRLANYGRAVSKAIGENLRP